MSEKPRAPKDHDLTGTGTPRSDDRGLDDHPGASPSAPVDPALVTGATGTSHPADADELTINRSGSGGSGGPAATDAAADPAAEEGSPPESMSELLSGEEHSEPGSR
jgi:hypothetical protein